MSQAEYLVRYGLLGDIGRFRAPAPLALTRGRRVVVRGPFGMQIGEVVRPAGLGGPGHGGELLRAVTREDEAHQAQLDRRAGQLAAEASALAGALGLSVEFLDAEILLDTQHGGLLHVCPPGTDLSLLRRQLEQISGLLIALVDVTRPEPEPAGGCGDCGSKGGGDCGSGGCSTGGCGSGSCGTVRPEEVQTYFADLRQQMERRVPLL